MNIYDHDVTELLKQWGAWSCSGLGSGSLETPTYDNDHWIDDGIGLAIDMAVGKLKIADKNKKNMDNYRNLKKYAPRYIAITLYYKDRYNIPMLADALKCGENKATLILKSGEAFIEAELGLHEVA
uniref:hypothetical protein n=1 Tax=Ningiella ruwaisensis TaxID=2364274 RepID=UPI0010A06B0F|nr:hypothetical protein [Ningiella ruwaisensis]